MAEERLNRFLARHGVASRRGADDLIAAGRVCVNDTVAPIGTVVTEGDSVTVDGTAVGNRPKLLTLMLNKPVGVVSTRRDPQHRPTVMELVEYVPGLVPVGRLDTDSRGLLLLSNDGDLVHRLTHPRYQVPKTYEIQVATAPTNAQLTQLRRGVDLHDGPARPLLVATVAHARHDVIEVVMGEGRKREVRRLCAAVGLEIGDLRRTGFGPLRLVGVAEGKSRRLKSAELKALYDTVGLRLS